MHDNLINERIFSCLTIHFENSDSITLGGCEGVEYRVICDVWNYMILTFKAGEPEQETRVFGRYKIKAITGVSRYEGDVWQSL